MSTHQTPGDLHTLVDAYTSALHHYVDVAVGVRSEASGPDEAVADPRLEVAAREAALAMGRLEDACTAGLGLTADVGMAWVTGEADVDEDAAALESEEQDDEDLDEDEEEVVADAFHLHFAVMAAEGATDEALDGALEVLEESGYEVVARLEEAGFEVPEFGISRGDPEPFDFFAESDDDEDPGPEGTP